MIRTSLHAIVALIASVALWAGDDAVKVAQQKNLPTEIRPAILVFGRELIGQWSINPKWVNIQPARASAYPGQHLILGVAATGDGRAGLLESADLTANLSFQGDTRTVSAHPRLIRKVKAEGADMVTYILGSLKTEKAEEAQAHLSMASIALFDVDWVVPGVVADGDLSISGKIQSCGKSIVLAPVKVTIKSMESSCRAGTFKDSKALEDWTMTYYQHPEPARILNALGYATKDQRGTSPNAVTFYVEVLKSSPEAQRYLLAHLHEQPHGPRLFGLYLLRLAGADITPSLAGLSEEDQRMVRQTPGLPDPYDLRVEIADSIGVPGRLDMLWSIFLATGDFKPIQAIAGTLAWRDDWKVFKQVRDDFQKFGKKPAGMTPELMRATAYMSAGWSLGSFYRNHGLAADYIESMKSNPMMPPVIREELGTLISNPAFKMEQ